MAARARWMAAGLAVGVGGSLWARRKARLLLARLSPASVAGGAVSRVRLLPRELREAVREGRSAMREREAELRARPQAGSRGPAPGP